MKHVMLFVLLVFVTVSVSAQTSGADWRRLTPAMRADAVVYLVAGWLASDFSGGPEKVNEGKGIVARIKNGSFPTTAAIARAITAFYALKGSDAYGLVDAFMVAFHLIGGELYLSDKARILSY